MGNSIILSVEMVGINISSVLVFALVPCILCSMENETDVKSQQPSWVDLECQQGHKYLFSDDKLIWEEARARCELYNGRLVDIGNVHEQNCLTRHALTTSGLANHPYWTDANDIGLQGIWMHDSTGDEVSFFGPKSITCNLGGSDWGPGNGQAILISMSASAESSTGTWCNWHIDTQQHYICKALI